MQKNYSIKLLITASLFLLFGSFSMNAQSCNSKLEVSKNRNARSATINDPTRFKMELTNNSSKLQSYEIQSVIFEDPCEAIGTSNTSARTTELNVDIISNNAPTTVITVPARSTRSFLAQVSVNPGAKLNVWKCVRLIAVSDACSKQEAQHLLKVYIPDPTEN